MKYIKRSKRRFLNSLPRKREYELSIFRIFLFLTPFILCLLFVLYLIVIENKTAPNSITAFIVIMLIHSPIIILTINYLVTSRISKIIFDVENEVIKIIENGVAEEIRYNEITEIELVTARNIETYYRLRKVAVPWFYFEYSILYLKNENKKMITCLLMNLDNLSSFLRQIKNNECNKRMPILLKNKNYNCA